MNCQDVQELNAELALGIVSEPERARAFRHVESCALCRSDFEKFVAVHDELIGLIPNVEPTLDFETRVLRNIEIKKAPRKKVFTRFAVAAAFVLIVSSSGLVVHITDTHNSKTISAAGADAGDEMLQASFVGAGRNVGTAFYYADSPGWLFMNVDAAGFSGTVHCEIETAGNQTINVGEFSVSTNGGYWNVPLGNRKPQSVALTSDTGALLATARFS